MSSRAVGPAHPRLVAAVVVVAEQDERGRLAHRVHGSSPSASSPRQTRTKRVGLQLVGHRRRVGVAGADDGLGRQREQHVHDRVLEVGVGRVPGRAHAADGVLEQRVAGEDVALDEQREHPAVWPGVCSGATSRPPTATVSSGLISPVAPSTRSSGCDEHLELGPALGELAELADVVVVVVGEQDVRRRQPWRSAASMSGSTGPPASTKKPAPPWLAHEVGVRQELRVHRAFDDHGGGTLASAMPELIHTCYRIGDIDRSVAFYEALGFEELRRMPIRDEAINVFMGLPGDGARLELTYNHGVDSYELGTGYNHIAITVADLDGDARQPGRAGHRAREAALHRARGRLAALLRARSGRLPDRDHRDRLILARRRGQGADQRSARSERHAHGARRGRRVADRVGHGDQQLRLHFAVGPQRPAERRPRGRAERKAQRPRVDPARARPASRRGAARARGRAAAAWRWPTRRTPRPGRSRRRAARRGAAGCCSRGPLSRARGAVVSSDDGAPDGAGPGSAPPGGPASGHAGPMSVRASARRSW